MRTLDQLRAIAKGDRCPAVLHNARLQARGTEWYGEEAIREAFRIEPWAISDGAVLLESAGATALFDGEQALFADRHEQHFMRLWFCSPAGPVEGEPAIDVPFDADLAQARGELFWRAEDHPELEAALHSALIEAGREICNGDDYRARAFCLRAFGTSVSGAALFAVHRIGSGAVREIGWSFAAAQLSVRGNRIVRDLAGEQAANLRPWRPRV